MAIDQDNTGLSGVSVGSITNVENASASTTDYASINLTINLLATANFAIKDQITNYQWEPMQVLRENTALLNLAVLEM
jgi:hypothetical protein